jgi:hypothetical protein
MMCNLDQKNFKKFTDVDSDGCALMEYSELLYFLNDIRITSGENTLEYQTGRKDFILGRMLEDKYIEFSDYQKAVLD